jgi:hypothetical protein
MIFLAFAFLEFLSIRSLRSGQRPERRAEENHLRRRNALRIAGFFRS